MAIKSARMRDMTCSIRGRDEMRIKFLSEILKVRNHLNNNIKTCFKETGCEDVDCIHLDEDMIHWWAVGIVVINLMNL
jgi:hypothetical protein